MSIKIYLRPNDNISIAMKKLKKICEKEGLAKELKKRAFYEKPSDSRRRAKLRSKKKIQKEQAERLKSNNNSMF